MEGAVLPGDALADHAGALVDEDRRRGRGGGGRVGTRMEEAGGGGAQHLGRAAAGGGHGDVLGLAAARAPLFPLSSRFDFVWGSDRKSVV